MNAQHLSIGALDTLLACEQFHRLPMMLADQTEISWTARLEEMQDKSRQLAMWLLCAQVARLFNGYPGIIETVELRFDKDVDDDGNDIVNGQLWINAECYDPGDDNEFDVDLMEAMEAIDGLTVLNSAVDAVAMAVPKALAGFSNQMIEPYEGEVLDNSAKAWALAETVAPDIHPHAQSLMLELSTAQAKPRAAPKGRL